jgi:hypothetical protein
MTDRDLQQKRIVAGLIDIGIAVAIWMVFAMLSTVITLAMSRTTGSGVVSTMLPRFLGFVGSLAGLGYVLGRDVLAGGRSLGKQLQGIRVVTTGGGLPIALMDSVRRNALFAIGSALGLISATLQLVPCLGDIAACVLWPLTVLGGFVSLGVAIFEMIKISQDPDGIRMGDQMANTRVVR